MSRSRAMFSSGRRSFFSRPGAGEELRCRADVIRAGKTLVFTEAVVDAVDGGRRIAIARATSTLAVVERFKA